MFLSMQNEKNHISMFIEDMVVEDAPMERLRTFYPDSQTSTSDRVVKTKTRYPAGMHAPFLINNRNMCRKYEKNICSCYGTHFCWEFLETKGNEENLAQ